MFAFEFPFMTTALAGVLSFALGIFWYHPKVLGARWMQARGIEPDAVRPEVKQFVISFLLWMLAACFYSFMVNIIHIDDIPGYFALSCLLWVAFAMPPLVMGALYTGYAFEAVSIDASYQLAGYYIFALAHILAGALAI